MVSVLGFVVYTMERFMISLSLLFVLVFKYCDHLAWGRESWSMCFSSICLINFHVLISVLFRFLLVSGAGCGLWLWHSLDVSTNCFFFFCCCCFIIYFNSSAFTTEPRSKAVICPSFKNQWLKRLSYLSRTMRKCVLCHMRTTKAQIRLRIRAVWSAPLFFAA